MKVYRTLTIQMKGDDLSKDDLIIEEVILNISVNEIEKIVKAKDFDPKYYDPYLLNEEQFFLISSYAGKKIVSDFEKNYYILDCCQSE